ncbi:MAG: PEGA domain-containing protein [Acidobacteria bacterium]|nr:PEGA domain-containing protein [Acidobacteriota bacterium]
MATVPFVVRTSPQGATIRIDGKVYGPSNLQVEVPEGTHQLQALKEGYEPESVAVTVNASPDAPASVELTLQPLAQIVRLHTDLESGRVKLDGEAVGELQEGEFTLDSVSPGSHTLEIIGRHSTVSVAFEMAPGALPRITSPVTAREFRAVALATLGGRAVVYCSFGPVVATVDGQPVGEVGESGRVLENLAARPHELILGEGEAQRKLVIESGPAPALTVSLSSDRDVGTLVVAAGEDDVRVLLDGREYRRRTRRGQLRIPNLAVKEYSVRVSKSGFQTVRGQRTEIRRGEETRLEFSLVPLPTVASLVIQDAMPGTQVLLDRKAVGTVQPDGTFSASNLEPGSQTVELRKEEYKPRQIARQFLAGESVRLSGSDVTLESAMGTLRISVSPPDSRVTLTRQGESQARPISPSPDGLTLPEGSYILSARAPNHSSRSASVQIVAGETRNLSLVLAEEKRGGMEDWEDPRDWSRDGEWFVRRGGDFTLFRTTPTAGRFVFTVALRRGRRLQWVLNQKDKKNYLLFQMDEKTFTRSRVRNGDSTDESRVEHGLGGAGYYTMQIKVTPGGLVHEAYDGKKWIVLDSWKEAGLDFTEGKFGFLIPRGDEVAVSNFTFYPQ